MVIADNQKAVAQNGSPAATKRRRPSTSCDPLVTWDRLPSFHPAPAIDQILQIAAGSEIVHYPWNNRGVAPAGYLKGMALVFARVYCKLKAGDPAAAEMAKKDTGNSVKDALASYSQQFLEAGMDNRTSGRETLRHLFVLLIGLGMRESSGRYCEGRDRSAANTSSNDAEAGLFQTSSSPRTATPCCPNCLSRMQIQRISSISLRKGSRAKTVTSKTTGPVTGRSFNAVQGVSAVRCRICRSSAAKPPETLGSDQQERGGDPTGMQHDAAAGRRCRDASNLCPVILSSPP